MSCLLFISPQFGRAAGGLGVSAERIVTGLREHHDVVVIVPDRSIPGRGAAVERSAGLSTIRVGTCGGPVDRLQALSELVHTVVSECRPSRILGFYGGEESYAGALAARELGLPFDLFLRGNDVDAGLFEPEVARLFYLLRFASRVFGVSSELVRRSIAAGRDGEAHFVPNGVDTVLFPYREPRKPDDLLRVLVVGEMKPKKGLDLLIHALDPKRHVLRIVGTVRPDVAKELQGLCQLRPELAASVEIVPYLNEASALVEHYTWSDLVCISSRSDGMPNVMLEALSCGRPVLGTAVGGMPDVIDRGENGWLCAEKTADSLTRTLTAAEQELRSGSRREALSQAARQTIEAQFSVQLERERYQRFYPV